MDEIIKFSANEIDNVFYRKHSIKSMGIYNLITTELEKLKTELSNKNARIEELEKMLACDEDDLK